jgi:hypothetical protein
MEIAVITNFFKNKQKKNLEGMAFNQLIQEKPEGIHKYALKKNPKLKERINADYKIAEQYDYSAAIMASFINKYILN